jgi:hypothetical protein
MSNIGLKAYLPVLGRIVDQMPISLYERQKALVAEGLLYLAPGRGPGSGVRATPEAVATMVCSLLSSTSLTGDLGPRTRRMAEAAGGPAFASTFVDELKRILSDEALAARIRLISVNPEVGRAVIHYDDKDKDMEFVGGRSPERPLSITINLRGDTVRDLAAAVKELS